ncbi:benzoate-CoA ligase family protein [Mesorhizobium sp. CAU 1732]|uniref:benzoate-CoA ligase family protein n=1 Tax=Mesorhizobium sp. CAU 1732 TaxID=3140358 RepID=UPI003260BB0C
MVEDNGNAALYFVDRHVAEGRGDKAAFVESGEGGRTLTYGGLAEQSSRMADLYARHGIQPEGRAAIIMLDEIALPVIFWGSLKAGVVPIPLNTLLSTDYYEIILNDARVKVLFVSPELLPAVEPILSRIASLRHVFVVGGEAGGHLSFADELAASQPGGMCHASDDECAFWLYSSGSTGRPKGVRHVHSSLKATSDTFGAQVLAITQDDVVLSAAKLFFAYGLGNSMTFPMSVGATAILHRGRPTPDVMFKAIEDSRPTIFCGVPTLFAAMLAHAGATDAVSTSLRICTSAGEALPAEVGNRWRQLFGVDILDGVGSTEMLHIFLANAPGSIVYGTSGVAVPGYAVKLVDEQGAEIDGPGEVGELLVNGPSAAENYWNQRDKSRSTFEGRWTRTGDKYERTGDGRFVYCGRTDDMFKVSGIWVAPFEVEQALVSHPRVLEAAVVPFRDHEGLEKPLAYVVLKDGAAADTLPEMLKAHVKERIGAWKYPRWISIVPELPKTATGKIQRFKLREDEWTRAVDR